MKQTRLMWLLLMVWLVGALAIGSAHASVEAGDRPNILWLTCEDISPNLGCYGDPDAVTPNLDALAAEGMRYDLAFSVAGVCAPSRSCLITGMYPTAIGSQHMRSTATLPDFVRTYSQLLREAGYYCTNNSKQDYNFKTPEGCWDESSNKAHYKNRVDDQPFFAIFNYTGTHESQVRLGDEAFARRTAGLDPEQRHEPAEIRVPAYHPDTPVVRNDWARYHDLISVLDGWIAEKLDELERSGLADSTIVFFYSDHGAGLPRGKRWIYDSGLRIPLIIRVPERYRHLAPDYRPGGDTDRLVSFVDFGPTTLSLAGATIPDYVQGRPFLGTRIDPPRKSIYAFRGRMDERYDLIRAVRDKRFKYIRNYLPHLPYAQRINYMEQMPTMREFRRLAQLDDPPELDGSAGLFLRPRKPDEELYDTVADPDEVRNLVDDPAYAEVLERLRAAHREHLFDVVDLGLLFEAEMLRRAEGGAPYELARRSDSGYYDQARIFETAKLRPYTDWDRSTASRLVDDLDDSDSMVRTWAATRLAAQAETLDEAALAALTGALDDDNPSVRIAVADALARAGRVEPVLSVLAEALEEDDPYVRLASAIVLDHLDQAARPVLPVMRAHLDDPLGYVQRVLSSAVAEIEAGG